MTLVTFTEAVSIIIFNHPKGYFTDAETAILRVAYGRGVRAEDAAAGLLMLMGYSATAKYILAA